MFLIMSRSCLSPCNTLPIVLVKVNLSHQSIKLCPRTYEPRLCTFWQNSDLAFLFLLLISGLDLLMWPLSFCSLSLLRMVDCDTFTPTLWRLLVMSVTIVSAFFFTALTMFCHELLMFSFIYQFDICC